MQIIPIRPRASNRPRLLNLLDEEPQWLFLRAPAGYDKTATVQAWLHAKPRRLKSALWIQTVSSERVDAAALTAVLEGQGHHKIVVLDATRLRHPLDRSTLEVLGRYARQIIVLARSVQTLPNHLIALLEATLVDADTLSYRSEEIATFIQGLDDDRVDRIRRATAGWPVLVRLVAPHEPHTSVQLSRVGAAFAAEQITHLSPLAAAVMQATCVVAEPTLALTAELGGLTEAEARRGWEEVVAEGLAASEGAGSGTHWQVIPLVREAQLADCKEEDSERVRELNRSAARWFAQEGQPVEAARHAIAAEDWVTAIEVIEDAAATLFAEHPAAARDLVHSIPSHAIENHSVVRIMYDMLSTAGGVEAQFTPAALTDGQSSTILTAEQLHEMLRQPEVDENTVEINWRATIRKRHEGNSRPQLRQKFQRFDGCVPTWQGRFHRVGVQVVCELSDVSFILVGDGLQGQGIKSNLVEGTLCAFEGSQLAALNGSMHDKSADKIEEGAAR